MHADWAQSGTLIAAGKKLEYVCIGPPPSDAPTLVLLHEGLGCIKLWRDVPATIAAATGFGVFVYSRAGYGESDPVELPRPLDYMRQEAIDVLPVILDAIGIRRAVLVGHSDGASIAAIYAGEVADSRVAGIVLIAPHFFTEPAGLAEIANARDAFQSGDLAKRLEKYHRDPQNAFLGWNEAWLDPEFRSWNISKVLDNICVPVLAIQGRDDPYGTLAQIDTVTQRVQKAVVFTLILDNCKHAPHLEQAVPVTTAIAEFCQQFSQQQTTVQEPGD